MRSDFIFSGLHAVAQGISLMDDGKSDYDWLDLVPGCRRFRVGYNKETQSPFKATKTVKV